MLNVRGHLDLGVSVMVTTRGKNVAYLITALGLTLIIAIVTVFEQPDEVIQPKDVQPTEVDPPDEVNRPSDVSQVLKVEPALNSLSYKRARLTKDWLDGLQSLLESQGNDGAIHFYDGLESGIYYDGVYPRPESNQEFPSTRERALHETKRRNRFLYR